MAEFHSPPPPCPRQAYPTYAPSEREQHFQRIIRVKETIFSSHLDTIIPNRYVECGEVFARIPRGGPASIVLYRALENEREALTVG